MSPKNSQRQAGYSMYQPNRASVKQVKYGPDIVNNKQVIMNITQA